MEITFYKLWDNHLLTYRRRVLPPWLVVEFFSFTFSRATVLPWLILVALSVLLAVLTKLITFEQASWSQRLAVAVLIGLALGFKVSSAVSVKRVVYNFQCRHFWIIELRYILKWLSMYPWHLSSMSNMKAFTLMSEYKDNLTTRYQPHLLQVDATLIRWTPESYHLNSLYSFVFSVDDASNNSSTSDHSPVWNLFQLYILFTDNFLEADFWRSTPKFKVSSYKIKFQPENLQRIFYPGDFCYRFFPLDEKLTYVFFLGDHGNRPDP